MWVTLGNRYVIIPAQDFAGRLPRGRGRAQRVDPARTEPDPGWNPIQREGRREKEGGGKEDILDV